MRSENERKRLSNAQYRGLVANWCDKLATHFSADLNEDQIEIFIEGLVKDSDYQIGAAFERCLNECEFMPKLRDVHSKMPEECAPRTTGAIRVDHPNVLDLNRPIAREICPRLYGCSYDALD